MNTFYLALGLGMQEMIVIFLIVLLLFGAKKIPELARGVGKGMGEFKKAKHEFEREIKMGEDEGKREWDKPVADKPVVDRPIVDRSVEDETHPQV